MVITVLGPLVCNRHGTGVQILRIFADKKNQLVNLYWYRRPDLQPALPNSIPLLTCPKVGPGSLSRTAERLARLCRSAWWYGDQVNCRKLRAAIDRLDCRPDVAYVCVSSETSAARAQSVLSGLGIPYVAHMWDLNHADGLDSLRTPAFVHFLHRAAAVLVVGDAMRQQVQRVCPEQDVRIVRFGIQATEHKASCPKPGEPLEVVVLGSLGSDSNPAIQLLGDLAMEETKQPAIRIHYYGQHYQTLDPRLKRIIDPPEVLPPEELQRRIARCHIGYLPSPGTLDSFGRFSLPSRITDYCGAGLPIIACIEQGSEAASFLRTHGAEAVRFVKTVDELRVTIHSLSEAEAWDRAHKASLSCARSYFCIDETARSVLRALEQAATKSSVIDRPQEACRSEDEEGPDTSAECR